MDLKQIAGEYLCNLRKRWYEDWSWYRINRILDDTKLGQRVKEGLSIQAVPTSKETEALAQRLNIPLISLNDVQSLDLTIDGADEIDSNLQLIKGGGGALLREKNRCLFL